MAYGINFQTGLNAQYSNNFQLNSNFNPTSIFENADSPVQEGIGFGNNGLGIYPYSNNTCNMINPFSIFQNCFMNMLQMMMEMFMNFMPQPYPPSPYDPGHHHHNPPIAPNEEGKIEGDPHITGGDGKKFDFQGQAGKTYDLFSTKNMELNGQFDAWDNSHNIVGKTGLTIQGDDGDYSNITFDKKGVASVNGTQLKEGQSVMLADGGTATLKNGNLVVTTSEGYTITESVQSGGNGNYINIDVKSGANGVDDGELPGGVLGQTFHPDWQPASDHEINAEKYAKDFEVNQLTPPDPYYPWYARA